MNAFAKDMVRPQFVSYKPAHQNQIESFFEEIWKDGPFPFDPTGSHSDLLNIPDVYQSKGGELLILMSAKEIEGVVAIKALTSEIAEVKRLNIRYQRRGFGWGDQLFRRALELAQANGFSRVRLDTIRNRGPAVHLFQKYGFVEIERYNDNPDADLFMELNLVD